MAQGLVEIISAAVVLVPEEVPYRMQYIQALQPFGIACLFFLFLSPSVDSQLSSPLD